MRFSHPRMMGFLAIVQLVTAVAYADVDLRVQAWPRTGPVDVFARVSEGKDLIAGLTPDDFAVTLDGAPVEQFAFTLPPSQDSTQKVSVVIVMREYQYSPTPTFRRFVRQLRTGAFVSVVKYWGDFEQYRLGGMSVLPFTELDDGPGTEQVDNFLRAKPAFNQPGTPHYLFDGLIAALSQFEAASATLPDGPKVIVTLDCCGGRISLSDVVASANAGGISIFNTAPAEWAPYRDVVAHTKALAANTGGIRIKLPTGALPQDALPTMSSLLRHSYRVSIPDGAISDCKRHRLAVTVGGESTSVVFSRCDTTPEPFRFRERLEAPLAKRVRSNSVTITGIDTAAPIRVFGGEYSIGCNTTFTSEPGRILPGESVCVRHTTAASGGLEVETLLIVGGVSGWFVSSTVF